MDDIQLPLMEADEREAEFMLLEVDDGTLTPNSRMAPGEMSASDFADVRDRGILVPIIVVPNATEGEWAYEVKDGRRRLRACRKLFEAGLLKFGKIPALVYTTYSEEDAETWSSNINSRRSPNSLSDLESIQAVLERYEVDFNTREGKRFLSSKTGIPVSTLEKRLKLLDMPQAFLQAAAENISGKKGKKVPIGALSVIAGLNKFGQSQLLDKLRSEGFISWEDVQHAKENQTAAKVAEMQHLPGFDSLALEDVTGLFKVEPTIEFTDSEVQICDINGEVAAWTVKEWVEDPNVVFAIANAMKVAFENGTQELRKLLNGNGNGHRPEMDPAGQPASD